MALQPASDAIIRVRDITVQFGKTRILDGLNLDVKRGEILGFVGPSGAGKSVLTRTIIGLVPKVAGRIEVFGVDLSPQLPAEDVRTIDEDDLVHVGCEAAVHEGAGARHQQVDA